jgi:peroxiredoxin
MSLKAQLELCRSEYEANVEPHVIDAARRSVQSLAETGLVAKAVKAGEAAPLFRLRRGRRDFIDLANLLNHGPVVISFLRGTWCPYCVLELQALAAAHPEIKRLGATLVALSPQARTPSSSLSSEGGLPFPVLQDAGCKIAGRYRIVFTVPQEFRTAYLALGYPRSLKAASKDWVLPIPATYVLDSAGLVTLSYLDADYTTRLEPTEIIVALTQLRAATIPNRNNR